jgi:tetratricopeptide (TPR) repeat protein
MTPELWQRLKPLYEAAVELPVGERSQFLTNACGGDDPLRHELEVLLRAHDRETSSLDGPLIDFHRLFPAKAMPFVEGELVMGRFRIVRHVGEGGMGDVYEAMDLELGRVALKTIRSDVAASPEVLARFRKEVMLARKVTGPHVCRIHEWFATDSRHAFLTMEFLDGVTLADKLHDSGPLPWREAKAIALEICAGLATIHDAGIVHGDLKSRNIMLARRNGRQCAVLMDFGLAREINRSSVEAGADFSGNGAVAGTLDYMAPEQFEGKELTPAADIYALGVVLYELVTGKHPFEAQTPLEAAVRRAKHPTPASAIQHRLPPNWDRIIDQCIEYEPSRRYSSAGEVAQELRAGPASFRNLRKDHPWLVRTAAALVLAALGWFAYLWWQSRQYYHPSEEARSWYEKGVAALREGSYLKAVRALQAAIEHDKNFPLAHARLAEAWADLDFTGPAQRELLFASNKATASPPLDREYIDAIRLTLVQDFGGSVQQYKSILDSLPIDQKSYGYLDLGRAFERAGDIPAAIKAYEKAAVTGAAIPAPYVHLGILKSRLQDKDGGDAAFARAETLYEADSDLEGRAEIAYQRGYAANVWGDAAKAHEYLQSALEIARQIPSVQLEVRALTQLSDAEDGAGKDDEALKYAKQAMQIANENGINYWSADALIRAGNAYIGEDDFKEAEDSYQQALHLAVMNQHPRLEANAELGLASLRDQQGKWVESIPLAQHALKYYTTFSFISLASLASAIIVRGKAGQGDFNSALELSPQLLEFAQHSNNPASLQSAEELIGGVFLSVEEFPNALTHYQKALQASRLTNQDVGYEQLHCADVLWQLGRYAEAEEMLAAISARDRHRSSISSGVEITRARMLLSQNRFNEAFSVSKHALNKFSSLRIDQSALLEGVEALAKAGQGNVREARKFAQQLTMLAHNQNSHDLDAEANLVEAIVYMKSNLPRTAIPYAEAAEKHFAENNEKESEWLTLLCLARAYRNVRDDPRSAKSTIKSLDILTELEQRWSPPVFRQYITRPDHQIEFQSLSSLRRG